MPTTPFKVLIAGGGVAGLTLALCLERANIDYVLLEAYKNIAPDTGASIGIVPHPARILDQLGVWDDTVALGPQLTSDTTWSQDGKKMSVNHVHDLWVARFGYENCFVPRRALLKGLYQKIEHKKRVLTGQRLVRVEQGDEGVVVGCENGKEYRGDILVGADGVYSMVREQMRNIADAEVKDVMKTDRKSLYADYSILWGIAAGVSGVHKGELIRVHGEGYSFMIIGGLDGVCFFFVFKKFPKRYHAPNIPRFTTADAERHASEFKDSFVSADHGTVRFGDIWSRRTVAGMAATEEAQNDHWSWGRLVCIGDSVHKITPNAGLGGGAAIEDAAVLTNELHALVNKHTSQDKKIPQADIKQAFTRFHATRKVRSKLTSEGANDFTRIEAHATWVDRMVDKYILPYSGDLGLDKFSEAVTGASDLDFLPEPRRATESLMGFNKKWGVGNEESVAWRVVRALPLLGIAVLAWWCMQSKGVVGALNGVPDVIKNGGFVDGDRIVSTRNVFTGVEWLDSFVGGFVSLFTPSIAGLDESMTFIRKTGQEVNTLAPQRLQMITFLIDLVPMNAIWLIESCRRGNIFTPIRLLLPFMILIQMIGIGIIAPIFFFLHTILLPPSKYRSLDNRLVQTSYAKTLLPALCIGYILPTILSYYPSSASIATLQAYNAIWQFFPLWLLGAHAVLARCITDTTFHDKSVVRPGPIADLPYLRATYAFCLLLSAGVFNYIRIVSPVSMTALLFKDLSNPWMHITSFVQGVGIVLRYDELFCFMAAAVWVLLCFGDLKKEGKVAAGWSVLLGVMGVGTVLGGLGATLVGFWWWREEALARKGVI